MSKLEESQTNSISIDNVSISKNRYWDILILVLSLYVLVELAIEIIYPFSDKTITIINAIDIGICAVFLGDFFYFLKKSEDRKLYIKKYWIDFVASIPFMSLFRAFRLARVIRIFRLFRGIKGLLSIVRVLGTNKLQNILISYVSIMTVVLFYCSLAFYSFEKAVNESVNVFFDAFWWAFITLTSVGYGDIFPTTTEGRVIGMVLTLCGMGLFSLVTAELATVLYKISQKQKS